MHISLIPEGGESFRAVNTSRRIFGLAIFLGLCFALLLFTALIIKKMESSTGTKIMALKVQISKVKSDTEKSMDNYSKVTLIGRQLKAAAGLIDSHYSFLKVFSLVEARTLPGIYYANLIGSREGRSFVLEARAPSFEEVARQIVAFKEDEQVERVSVSAITADVSESGAIKDVKFVLTLVLKEKALK